MDAGGLFVRTVIIVFITGQSCVLSEKSFVEVSELFRVISHHKQYMLLILFNIFYRSVSNLSDYELVKTTN